MSKKEKKMKTRGEPLPQRTSTLLPRRAHLCWPACRHSAHASVCVCVSQRLCHSLAEALLEDSWITNVWEFGRFSAHAVHSECDQTTSLSP